MRGYAIDEDVEYTSDESGEMIWKDRASSSHCVEDKPKVEKNEG